MSAPHAPDTPDAPDPGLELRKEDPRFDIGSRAQARVDDFERSFPITDLKAYEAVRRVIFTIEREELDIINADRRAEHFETPKLQEIRQKVCQWMFSAARHYKLSTDTAGRAMYLFDWCASIHRTKVGALTRKGLNLTAATVFWMASKTFETVPITLIELFEMTKIAADQLIKHELVLLAQMKQFVAAPNAFQFVRDFIAMLPLSAAQKSAYMVCCFFLLERTIEEVESIQVRPSALAKAVVDVILDTNSLAVEETTYHIYQFFRSPQSEEARKIVLATAQDRESPVSVDDTTDYEPPTKKQKCN